MDVRANKVIVDTVNKTTVKNICITNTAQKMRLNRVLENYQVFSHEVSFVPKVLDIIKHHNFYTVTCEYIPGRTVGDIFNDMTALQTQEIMDVMTRACAFLNDFNSFSQKYLPKSHFFYHGDIHMWNLIAKGDNLEDLYLIDLDSYAISEYINFGPVFTNLFKNVTDLTYRAFYEERYKDH